MMDSRLRGNDMLLAGHYKKGTVMTCFLDSPSSFTRKSDYSSLAAAISFWRASTTF